jgi:hypothetical protein
MHSNLAKNLHRLQPVKQPKNSAQWVHLRKLNLTVSRFLILNGYLERFPNTDDESVTCSANGPVDSIVDVILLVESESQTSSTSR